MIIGTDANPNELEKVTTNRKNMIESPKSEDSKALGKKIMKTIAKGKTFFIHQDWFLKGLRMLLFFSAKLSDWVKVTFTLNRNLTLSCICFEF